MTMATLQGVLCRRLNSCLKTSLRVSQAKKIITNPCRVGYATSSNSKVYEIRTYTVKPNNLKEYLKCCEECMPTRLKFSNNVGYWMCEFGALNTFIHIWDYESLSQRAEVRVALSQSPEWLEKAAPMFRVMESQDNVLCQLCDWSNLQSEVPEPGGMYKLLRLQMIPSSPWNQTFKEYVNARQDAFNDVMGAWWTVVGPKPTVFGLFHHQHIDFVVTGKNAPKDKLDRLEKAGTALEAQASHMHSFLMTPTSWSSLK